MENVKNLSESIICSGSDMNHRTFRDDESWNSLQSTILAGHFSLSKDSDTQEDKNNLTTLNEESLMEELEFKSMDEDENVLNINLDAISDDVFFDCQNNSNQKILNESNSPVRNEMHSNILQVPSKQQFLTVDSTNSPTSESTADSGVEEEKTGALLVQIVEDFKDMKEHAQSTPKHLSPTTNISKSLAKPMNSVNNNNNNNANDVAATSLKIMTNVNNEINNCSDRKTLNCLTSKAVKRLKSPCYKQYSPVDRANKENFFVGKYSGAMNVVCKADANVPSPVEKKPRKVAEMKEFFENQSKLYEQSRSRQAESKIPVRKAGRKPILITKSPQVRSTRSPSYHTQETFKLLKTSKAFKANGKGVVTFNNNNNGTSSFFLRNQAHNANRARPSSCSDFIADSPGNYNISKNTSKSTGDLSKNCIKHTKLLYATERKMINKRSNHLINQCMTLNPKSPKNSLKVSDIMKRKSFGYVSSPVKPVKELRKIFSPGREFNAQIKKRSNKKTPAIKIIVSNE